MTFNIHCLTLGLAWFLFSGILWQNPASSTPVLKSRDNAFELLIQARNETNSLFDELCQEFGQSRSYCNDSLGGLWDHFPSFHAQHDANRNGAQMKTVLTAYSSLMEDFANDLNEGDDYPTQASTLGLLRRYMNGVSNCIVSSAQDPRHGLHSRLTIAEDEDSTNRNLKNACILHDAALELDKMVRFVQNSEYQPEFDCP